MSKACKSVNKKFVYDEYKTFTSWEAAAAAAERLLLRIQVREREVKAVIRLFKERMKTGEPWPGEDAGTKEKSVPA